MEARPGIQATHRREHVHFHGANVLALHLETLENQDSTFAGPKVEQKGLPRSWHRLKAAGRRAGGADAAIGCGGL